MAHTFVLVGLGLGTLWLSPFLFFVLGFFVSLYLLVGRRK